MKRFYSLLTLLFFGLTFNLSAQETVIAVWDFADNSVAGDINPDFSSALNTDLDYLNGGQTGANAWTNTDVVGGDFDNSYTLSNSSPLASAASGYILNNLNLGPTTATAVAGSGLINNKIHFSLSFKSISLASASDKLLFYLKDANSGTGTNWRQTGFLIQQNTSGEKIEVRSLIYNAGNSAGTQKLCGNFGTGLTLADFTIGVTLDYDSAGDGTNVASIRFWIGSPDNYSSGDGNAWGFKIFNNDGFANTDAFPALTATPTANAAIGLANSVTSFLQFTPNFTTEGSEVVFDQIKISTGEYENTVAAGNTSTPDNGITELYFSKYAEGSSNNKFLEIYNGTDNDIDLSNYAFPNVTNDPTTAGEYENWNTFTAGAIVAAGDVYVIAHPSADASILALADQTHSTLSNGDDGYALVSGTETSYVVIDWLGDFEADPGSGWAVAGITNGTVNHTLTRKSTVCGPNNNWASSAGTNAEDSEWIVGDSDSGWDTIGSYTGCVFDTTAPVITLVGANPQELTVGDAYAELGATATDDTDDDTALTATIVIDASAVDTATAGSYSVTYDVSDAAGNAATQVTRTVTVEAAPAPLLITTSVCATATSVRLTGPWWGWDPAGGPIASDNGDGTWTFTLDPAPTADMEYLLVVDGVQENLIANMANGGDCAPITDFFGYANRLWETTAGDITNNYGQCGASCVVPVITMTGSDSTITVGDVYTDAGATASDDEEGDITANIIVVGAVDTTTAGTYTVTYNVSDGALNAATQVTRTVNVEAAPIACGDTVTHCYTGGTYSIFDSAVDNAGDYITVTINAGETESGYDDLVVYDTSDTSGNVLYSADGDHTGQVIESTTGVISVWISGDGSWNCTDGGGGPYTPLEMVVSCAAPPACITPTDLSVSDVTTTGATLNWVSDGSQFMIELQPAGSAQGTAGGYVIGDIEAYTATSVDLTGFLMPNTSYSVYVVNVCANGNSEYAGPFTFTTPCDVVSGAWSNDFETNTDCWLVSNGGDANGWGLYANATDGGGAFSYGIYYGSTAHDDYLISPAYSVADGVSDRMSFDTRNISTSFVESIDVQIWNADISTVLETVASGVAPGVAFETFSYDLSAYEGQDIRFAFHITTTNEYAIFIDNVVVDAVPACITPTDLNVSDVTTTGATLNWVSDGSQFMIELLPSGVPQGTAGGYVIGDVDPYPLTSVAIPDGSLTSNTSYDFYVVNVCADGNSEYAGPFTFTTSCDTVTVFPYLHGFEDLACWSNSDSSAAWALDDGSDFGPGSVTEGVSAVFFNDYDYSSGSTSDLMSPNLDLSALTVARLSFDYYDGGGTDTVDVLVDSGSGPVVVYTTDATVSTWTTIEIDLPEYAGQTIQIGFRGSSIYGTSNPHIDNLMVAEAPSCLAPSDLVVSSITTTTASVAWTANNSETAWEYQLVETGVAPEDAGTATVDNPLSLSNLTDNTAYDVYVRANCGTDFSAWSMVTFTTLPAPIVPDYMNDFATYPGDLWSEGEGALADGPSGTSSAWATDGFANDGFSGAARVNVYHSSFSGGNNDWLISPVFDLSVGSYYLNLDAAATEYGSSTLDAVWGSEDYTALMISEDAGQTWTELYRWDATNSPGLAGAAMPEVDLSVYTGLATFALYAESFDSVEDVDFFVDNFSIGSTSLSLNDVSTVSNFTFFPNPVNNVLTIKAQASIDSITVYNMLGQTVVRSTPNTNDCTVDMSLLQSGAYFVQVSINNTLKTVRVIKN